MSDQFFFPRQSGKWTMSDLMSDVSGIAMMLAAGIAFFSLWLDIEVLQNFYHTFGYFGMRLYMGGIIFTGIMGLAFVQTGPEHEYLNKHGEDYVATYVLPWVGGSMVLAGLLLALGPLVFQPLFYLAWKGPVPSSLWIASGFFISIMGGVVLQGAKDRPMSPRALACLPWICGGVIVACCISFIGGVFFQLPIFDLIFTGDMANMCTCVVIGSTALIAASGDESL